MVNKNFERAKNYKLEPYILLIAFIVTWLGFGSEMAGLITVAFIFALFFKTNRILAFEDRTLLILLVPFVLNNVVSSLLSIDKLVSALLSLVWFLVIFIPMTYVRFAFNKENEFFYRRIVPLSIIPALIIVVYLLIAFIVTVSKEGLVFKRHSFYFLGTTTTADVLIMLGGLGYGWFRQKKESKFLWLGFLYLLFSAFGIALTEDRGAIIAIFVLTIVVLSHDYRRLILFFLLVFILIYLSSKIGSLRNIRYLYDYVTSKGKFKFLWQGAQLDTFRTAWLMIKDHWVMGVGTNNFSSFSKQYGSGHWYAYAHNFILQFWAENGLFGMILGLSIIGLILYRWAKSFRLFKYKYIALGVGASFIGMLVENLTNSTIWKVKIALPFWLLAGVISEIYFIVKQERGDGDS